MERRRLLLQSYLHVVRKRGLCAVLRRKSLRLDRVARRFDGKGGRGGNLKRRSHIFPGILCYEKSILVDGEDILDIRIRVYLEDFERVGG